MNIEKNAYVFSVSKEMYLDMLAMKYGPPFMREVASRTETPPTEEQWTDYHRAVELLAELENNPYFHVDGYDGVRVQEPQPAVHVEYAETEDEYVARVMELNPDDYETIWDRTLSRLQESFRAASDFEEQVAQTAATVNPALDYQMPEYPPRHPATYAPKEATP